MLSDVSKAVPYIHKPSTYTALRALVVGSTGRMGAFFLRRFTALDVDVCGIDVPFTHEDLCHGCEGRHFVILCIPAAALEATVTLLVPYLPATAVMMDITSVKVQPMEHMQTHWQGPVIGTHPLFGPQPSKGDPMPMAMVAGHGVEAQHICLYESMFTQMGCSPFWCTDRQHDKAMAAIQNLNFITSLAYFAALAPLTDDEDMLPFLTPSFRRRQDAAKRMLTEDAELFTGLFQANPYSHELVRRYRGYLNIAAGGDIDLLAARAQWWWK